MSGVIPHEQEIALEQARNAERVWWGNVEGKGPLERSRRIDKDNVKVGPKKQDGRAGVRFIRRWLRTRTWGEGLL
jgi:hypothetical protein